jgi:hypothetical protein
VRRAGLIAAGTLGVVAIAGAAAWYVAFRDTAEPVTVDAAVRSFRTDTEATPPGPSPIPEGVYVYTTRGFEKTDALTGVTHRYPARSTITVAAHECGVSLTWRVLKGRSTEWVYCATPAGWELRSQDERHTFFGRTERTAYTCENTPIRPARAPVGMHWEVSCSTDGALEDGTAKVVERRTWSLRGGSTGTGVLIRKSTRFTGDIRGTARHDLYFDSRTGLPVTITMVSRTTTSSPIGDVRYDEDVMLRLLSLEPRR